MYARLSLYSLFAATLAFALFSLGCGDGPATQRFVLVSGGQTGVYYPTASAIASVTRRADGNIRLDNRPSGGSVNNARMIASGEAQFALMQNDIAAYAREGRYMFGEPMPNILGVAALYPEHVQIVALADAGIQSVEDLRGKRVAIGAIGSGTEANAGQILEAAGLSVDDLARAERLSASESSDYLQDGRVDAAFFTFGVGTSSIQELARLADINFVPVEGDVREQLLEQYPFYREAVIPAGAYPEQDADVPTVSVMATLVARDDVPAEVVAVVLRAMFDNVDELHRTHARLREVNREDAEADLTLPVHPGAEAYYAGRTEPAPAGD
ncbi:MAG: TAXI family TRAP transporter solute-binding subunit [Phycisphaeraceae bacterium]